MKEERDYSYVVLGTIIIVLFAWSAAWLARLYPQPQTKPTMYASPVIQVPSLDPELEYQKARHLYEDHLTVLYNGMKATDPNLPFTLPEFIQRMYNQDAGSKTHAEFVEWINVGRGTTNSNDELVDNPYQYNVWTHPMWHSLLTGESNSYRGAK